MMYSLNMLLIQYYWLAPSMAALVIAILFYLYNLLNWPKMRRPAYSKGRAPPEVASGGWLAILGDCFQYLFRRPDNQQHQLPYHHILATMADQYGPAFLTKFGKHRTLVVSSPEIVKDCFTNENDTNFSDRSTSTAFQIMTYGDMSVGFTPYSPYWRELRKICALKLLSNQRLNKMRNARASEVNACFKELYNLWKKKNEDGGRRIIGVGDDKINDHPHKSSVPILVDMKKWFEEVSNNVILRATVGKRSFWSKIERGTDAEAVHYKKVMDEQFRLAGISMQSDLSLLGGLFNLLRGHVSAMKRTAKDIDAILERWLDEHRSKKQQNMRSSVLPVPADGSEDDLHDQEDFMDGLLSIIEDNKFFSGHDVDTVVKATCLAMILGGMDTTAVTLTWVVSLLMNNRDALRKAKEEIRVHVGMDRQVEDSDMNNLIYLKAIIKEAMRLHPIGPLLERETKDDCVVGGFRLEAGTRLLVNIWKIQRDPKLWTDPTEFRPERFLVTDSDMNISIISNEGQNFHMMPFGAGKRICPGVSYSLNFMDLVLARLIHGFEMGTQNDEAVGLTETIQGHVNYNASPLHLLLTPCLHSSLYM